MTHAITNVKITNTIACITLCSPGSSFDMLCGFTFSFDFVKTSEVLQPAAVSSEFGDLCKGLFSLTSINIFKDCISCVPIFATAEVIKSGKVLFVFSKNS